MNDPVCPRCHGVHIVKNGQAHTGKQRYLCRECRYQFTPDA
ncbi:IS1/IS1595 family N-terminal zinc-binding domain-containing protein, partial [Deinococcus metallilatus]